MPQEKIALDNFGLGTLSAKATSQNILYKPFEASPHQLGIIASANLKKGEELTLKTQKNQKIAFTITEKKPLSGEKSYRYSLACNDTSTDIEEIVVFSGCQKKMEILTKEKIQATRFITDPKVHCEVNTFGSKAYFDLNTINISRSGMLLVATKRSMAPFHKNTLVEINLSDKGSCLDKQVKCIGKVIRCYQEKDAKKVKEKFFGIDIIEFDKGSETVWQDAIEALASMSLQAKPLLSA